MSGNVNGNNELASKIINQYKEMYKQAGGNVDSLNDSQIASIFQQDLMDGNIDGLGKDDNNNTITLIENFKEKVSKEDIDNLTNDVLTLKDQLEASNRGGGSVISLGSTNNNGGVSGGSVSGSPVSGGSAASGSHAEKFLNNMRSRTPSDVQETNPNDGDSNYYYSTFLNEAKQWAASNGFSTDVNPEYNYKQYLQNVDLDTITSNPEKKGKYQQLLSMYDKMCNDEMDVATCYQFAKENFGDLNMFKLAEASVTGKLFEGGSSESTRQYRVLVQSLIRSPELTQKQESEEEKIETKPPLLNEEQVKLAQDIANGKYDYYGYAGDANHPLNKLNDKTLVSNIKAAAFELMRGHDIARYTETRTSNNSNFYAPSTDAEALEINAKNSEKLRNDAAKYGKANSGGSVSDSGSASPGGSVSGGGSSDVNGTSANGKNSPHGIPDFDKMTKKEKKEALRAREKELAEQIKEAKEQVKANPDDRDALLRLENLQDAKTKAHQAYRQLQPALFKTVMGVVSPLLGLTGVLGSYVGLASNITDTLKDVNTVYNNVNKLVK